MKRKTDRVRKQMEKLVPLDLSKTHTVSEIVDGMSRCSFGARMLGEVAKTLTDWTSSGRRPYVVSDWLPRRLKNNVNQMVQMGWFTRHMTSVEYLGTRNRSNRVLVIGNYNESTAEKLHHRADEMIFINQYGRTKPGQVRDGYFPNVVFSDPSFIIPLLLFTLLERKGTDRFPVSPLFQMLTRGDGLAKEVVRGGETLLAMCRDKRCTKFLTLSGAMTVAKMQLLVCEMIDRSMVDYIASTGALMAHGLIEGIGDAHYKYNPEHSDKLLAKLGINRVTDALEPEENFEHLDKVMNVVLGNFRDGQEISPSMLHREIGRHLRDEFPKCRGILRSAYENYVPISVPAFHDSEIGNDVFVHNLLRKQSGRAPLLINQELDTKLLVDKAIEAERIGIFSIGGGVPRNNTQNLAPLIEIANNRGAAKLPMRKFRYGCRIDPTPLYYGNLSGCTYNEGGSWRKMDLEKGKFAEVHADATIVWPFILKYVMENL